MISEQAKKLIETLDEAFIAFNKTKATGNPTDAEAAAIGKAAQALYQQIRDEFFPVSRVEGIKQRVEEIKPHIARFFVDAKRLDAAALACATASCPFGEFDHMAAGSFAAIPKAETLRIIAHRVSRQPLSA